MEEGAVRKSTTGTPQGGVISPLLANIVLDELDETWEREWSHLGDLVRYADDFVIACRTKRQAEEALVRVRAILESMGLALHPDKTRVVELRVRGEGFDFLGCHLRIVRSHFKGKTYLFRWPSHEGDDGPAGTDTSGDELATLDADGGHPRGDRGAEPDPAGVVQLLPHGERLAALPQHRPLRDRLHRAPAAPPSLSSGPGPQPTPGPLARGMDARRVW